jgi:membrane fusion protein (multidrug efflux system)
MQVRAIRCAVLVAGLFAGCSKAPPPPPPAPPDVKVATVLQRDVPIYVEAIGQTRGSTEIEIRARVEGFIQTVNFTEGTLVSKGQLLYTIDPRPFQATLAQAQGAAAQAAAEKARAHQVVARYEPLAAKNAIPRQQYETAVAVERAAEAAQEAADAAVERAQIDLGYTKVTAPEAGLIGRTEVYPGTLVGRGESTILTHISQIDTIHVRFTLAERDYLTYARRFGEATKAAAPSTRDQYPFQLILADDSVLPDRGRLIFVDRNVDPTTGTILLEAAFPNPQQLVRPGQYARVRATADFKQGALLVPQRAVQELQGVYNVAVVGADNKAEIRTVTPAERINNLWVIDTGLKPGDRVIVEGLQKIRPGVTVKAETVTIDESPSTPGK